jgi:hypothetical protein
MNFDRIKKFTFALTLILGFAVAPALSSLSTVQAQHRNQMSPMERAAFREGFRLGREDARSNRRYDYNSRYYRQTKRDYRDDYRKGYSQGYRRG